jgi:uncharacterized protein VirK/YbjX
MSHALPNPPSRKTFEQLARFMRKGVIRQRVDRFFLRDLSLKGVTGFLGRIYRFFAVFFDFFSCWPWLVVLSGKSSRILFWVYPRIIFRYTLPYLSADFERYQRLEMMKAHYHFINRQFSPQVFAKMLVSGVCLHRWCEAGRTFSIILRGPCLVTRHREGELSLVFQIDGSDLYKVAFSLFPKAVLKELAHPGDGLGARDCLYVGQIQGQSGQIELLREASSLCRDVAPQDALMSALAGVAQACSIDTVLGVLGHHNLSLDALSKSQSHFDYDAFWARYHAVPVMGNRHCMMTIPYPEKSIQEIASKHRRRTLDKRQFKQGLVTAVSNGIDRLMVSSRSSQA